MAFPAPKRKRHWVNEIEKASTKAMKEMSQNSGLGRSLFSFAPDLVAQSRNITDKQLLNRMHALSVNMYELDRDTDPDTPEAPLFHFVSSYIFSHVEAGLITEREADSIMDYVNDNMDLFD